MQDRLNLLHNALGFSDKANRDYHQFHCPFCNHPKHKLGISLTTGRWKCWVCHAKGSKISQLFFKIRLPASDIQLAKLVFDESKHQIANVHEQLPNPLTLPAEYSPLLTKPSKSIFYSRAVDYVKGRGITEQDILKHRIGYCESGKYSYRIIFPSFDWNGSLNLFTGRTFMDNPIKFINPPNVNKDIISDEDLINWQEPVILVESKLDAIVVKRNAIPLNGKEILPKLRHKIIEESVPKVIICLDGDAISDAILGAEYFLNYGIEVEIVELPPNEDPCSLGFVGVWKYIKIAKKITNSELFKYKIRYKLK